MKKTRLVIWILNIILLACIFVKVFYVSDKQMILSADDSAIFKITINVDGCKREIHPWHDAEKDRLVFFVPGNLKDSTVYLDSNIFEKPLTNGQNTIEIEQEAEITLTSNGKSYQASFIRGSQIPSLFIETSSGSMDTIHSDKQNREKGSVLSLSFDGQAQYNNDFKYIRGHGNDTWMFDKKPYSLEFDKDVSLAGLSESKEWVLLAMSLEGDKIHSKLAYDMAEILLAECQVETEWVDLYTNGEYRGLYLLAQSVKAKNEFNQKGNAFLVEKEIASRCGDTPAFLLTNQGNNFIAVRPKNKNDYSSVEQTLNQCEEGIYSGSLEGIDLDSFVTQYIIEEMSMNFDAYKTSAYYFKKSGSDTLYAGPAWDYDGAFGEYLHQGENWVNYNLSVTDIGWEQLSWWKILENNESFRKATEEKLSSKQRELENLFTNKLDEYSVLIKASAYSDSIRWKYNGEPFKAGTYQEYDSNLRYLRYFLAHRLAVICSRYGSNTTVSFNGNETVHKVTFRDYSGKTVYEINVPDGDSLVLKDYSELNSYQNGQWVFEYSNEGYNKYLPILEDCTLVFIPYEG